MGSAPDVGDILKQVRCCAQRQIGAAQIESCCLPTAPLQSSPVWGCLSSSAPTSILLHIAHKVACVVTRTLSGSSSAALLQGQVVSLKLKWHHQCFQHRRSCVVQVSSIVESTCNPDMSLGDQMRGESLAHRVDEVWIRTGCNTTAKQAYDTLCPSPLFSFRACLPFEDAPLLCSKRTSESLAPNCVGIKSSAGPACNQSEDARWQLIASPVIEFRACSFLQGQRRDLQILCLLPGVLT